MESSTYICTEYVRVRPLCGQCLEWPSMGDEEEECCSEHSTYCSLNIAEFDTIQVHDTENVCCCNRIQYVCGYFSFPYLQ
jgi:hypothetical protein